MEDFKPAIGRIVHCVLPDGQHRPAIIVRVWDQYRGLDGVPMVNLQVFTDQTNDGFQGGTEWRTSVHFDASDEPGTWHWPERTH